MSNTNQDDLIILDETITDLDWNNSNNLTSEVSLPTETITLEQPISDNWGLGIDLSNLSTESSLTSDVKTEEVSDLLKEETTWDSLIIENSEGIKNEDIVAPSSLNEDFDLDEFTERFIVQLNSWKDHIVALIKDNEDKIKNLEAEVKDIEKQISDLKVRGETLSKENERIDARINLLTWDIKTNFNKLRKKA